MNHAAIGWARLEEARFCHVGSCAYIIFVQLFALRVGWTRRSLHIIRAKCMSRDASQPPAPLDGRQSLPQSFIASPPWASAGAGSLAPPSAYSIEDPARGASADGAEADNPEVESDEEQWQLHEAAEDAAEQGNASGGQAFNAPNGNFASPAGVETLVESFVSHHSPGLC